MLSQFKSIVVICLGVYLGSFGGVCVLTAQESEEGNVIRIGPDRGAEQRNQRRPVRQQPVIVSQFWIGIEAGEASPALRSQLRLKEDQGLLINQVKIDSPADEGELKVYDVITRVNGKPVRTVRQLTEHVGEQGERKGRLAVEFIREGLPKTVFVTPAERPVSEVQEFPNRGGGFGDDIFGGPFRNFQQQQIRNGVSISIQQSGDGPPKISVQRGNERWEIEGDDPEALAQLPDDLRNQVESMLGDREDEDQENGLNGFRIERMRETNERIREIEREMNRLRKSLEDNGPLPGLFQPEIEPDPVPQAEPSEIELPAEAD